MSKASLFKALRDKGLSGEKYIPDNAMSFIGPQKTRKRDKSWYGFNGMGDEPADTYWSRNGKHQDLNAELEAAMESGRYERNEPWAYNYYRYYNDGDVPKGIPGRAVDNHHYNYPYEYKYTDQSRYPTAHLTAVGERQLENNANAAVLNEYQKYMKGMESGKIPEAPTGGYGLSFYGGKVFPGEKYSRHIVSFPDKESALKAYPRYEKEYGAVDLVEPHGPVIPKKLKK